MRTFFLWLVAAGLLSLSIAVAAFAQCQLAFNEPQQDDTDIAALIDEAVLAAIDPYAAELSDIPANSPESSTTGWPGKPMRPATTSARRGRTCTCLTASATRW